MKRHTLNTEITQHVDGSGFTRGQMTALVLAVLVAAVLVPVGVEAA